MVQREYQKKVWYSFLSSELNKQRLAGELCDVILTVGERQFHVHRNVLAAHSPYFRGMFMSGLVESGMTTIAMDVSIPEGEILDLLIDYFYQGKITINEDNAQALLAAADLLLLDELKPECCLVLKAELATGTCLALWVLADRHSCEDLRSAALHFVLNSFESVVAKQGQFLELALDHVLMLLKSDKLAVESEDTVFKAAMRWLRFDETSRKSHLVELLSAVRLTLCTEEFLAMTIDEDALIQSNDECRGAVAAAIEAKNNDQQQQPPPKKQQMTSLQSPLVLIDQPRTPQQRQTLCLFVGIAKSDSNMLEKIVTTVAQGKALSVAIAGIDRGNFATVTLAGRIFVLGGILSVADRLASMECYNTSSGQWQSLAPMPTNRSKHCATVLDGLIYAIGGFTANAIVTASVDRYDPAGDQWTSVAPLATARRDFAAVTLDGAIYVLGGSSASIVQSGVERFEVSSGNWTAATPMRAPRKNFGCAAFNGKIFIAGGTHDRAEHIRHRQPLASVECFDPVSQQWTGNGAMNEARQRCSLTVVDGRLLATGGYAEEGWLESVEEYDPETDSWRLLCNLKNLQHSGFRTCVVPALFDD